MRINRRNFLTGAVGLMAGLKASALAQSDSNPHSSSKSISVGGDSPVDTPHLPKLPYELKNGVKVFTLVAEPVKREFLPGKVFDVWGYNGSVPGPTIEVMEGDRVRILFENKLPEATTVHWHGLEVPIKMDGVPAISQPLVYPGENYTYEFKIHQRGTFFYHSHMPMQEMMGMIGFFVIHPRVPYQPRVDKDFGLILQEWGILPNNTVPNTLSMEFNWLTMNGKAGPAIMPLIVKLGHRVRIRLVNLGMDQHPIHLHGHQFYMTGTEAGRVPKSAWYPQNTVLVGVAQARDIEFEATYPGDWLLHCHLPHHMMNQMVSMVGPMAHVGSGSHTGMGMEEGMGMVRKGHALSEELGPGLGRGMGMTTREKQVSNIVGGQQARQQGHHSVHAMGGKQKRIPGYPQDMWMPMDGLVAKPETYGLAPNWSGAVMGMMTVVRVLRPDMYAKVMKLARENRMSI